MPVKNHQQGCCFVYGDIYISLIKTNNEQAFFSVAGRLSLPLPATAVCKHSPVLHPGAISANHSLAKAGVIKPLTGKFNIHHMKPACICIPHTVDLFFTRLSYQIVLAAGMAFAGAALSNWLPVLLRVRNKTDGVLMHMVLRCIARRKKDIQYSNEVVFVNVVVSHGSKRTCTCA